LLKFTGEYAIALQIFTKTARNIIVKYAMVRMVSRKFAVVGFEFDKMLLNAQQLQLVGLSASY